MEHRSEESSHETGRLHDVWILVNRDALPVWFSLLQQGFLVEANLGRSLTNVLSDQIGLSPEYLEERVQTIFMDGKAVDSLETTLVAEGCVVALSAAMPGFVGAAFRRSGYYAVMRSSTTHHHEHGDQGERRGRFTLKLFNLLADELGEFFFTRGILIESHALAGFLKKQPESFLLRIMEVHVDGVPVDLMRALSPGDEQGPLSHPDTLFRALVPESPPCDVLRIAVVSA